METDVKASSVAHTHIDDDVWSQKQIAMPW